MQDLNDFAWFVKVVDHGGFPQQDGPVIYRNPASAVVLRSLRSGWACD